jgi:PAS domain S-box-containing protein
MLNLDIRTLSVLAMLSSVLLAIGLQLVSRVITKDPSLRLWALGATVNGVGFVLLALRGLIPDLLSIVLGNTLLVAGSAWLYQGNQQFVGRKKGSSWYWFLTAVAAVGLFYFTYQMPSLTARTSTLSAATAAILLPCALILLRPGNRFDRTVRWFVAAGFLTSGVFFGVRAVLVPIVAGQDQDFMASTSPVHTLSLVFGIALNIILGIGLPLLISGRMRRQLFESEQRMELALAGADLGLWDLDIPSGRLNHNSRLVTMLGYAPGEVDVNPDTFALNLHPSDWPQFRSAFYSHLKAQTLSFEVEYRLRHKDGHWVWLLSRGKVVKRSERGRAVRVIGTSLDNSERKASEQRVVEERHRFHDFSQSTADWFWEMDSDLRFSYFSDNFEETYGLKPETLLGKTRPELLALDQLNPTSQIAEHLSQIQQHLPFRDFEYRIRNSSEEIRWISISGVPYCAADGSFAGYRGVGRVITARKQMEQELELHRNNLERLIDERTQELAKAKEAAEVANVAKSTFLSNISHEMRTPLHQVSGMAYMVKREPLSPKQASCMDKLEGACDRMTNIVDRVLKLTSIESRAMSLSEEPFNVDELVNMVVSTVQAESSAKHLELIVEPTHVPTKLIGDPAQIKIALLNYVSNAIRYTEKGSVTLRSQVVEDDGSRVLIRFEVQDTGIGISPENQPRVFSIFEQVDNSSTRKYGGLGIGVAMTKKIAQCMGGDASLSSTPGQGSTFWFTVRLTKVIANSTR